jgi:hypothetical protein
MATNDTKVHTRDAQFPPISETARTMTAALSVNVSSPQVDEDKFPNVVQALKRAPHFPAHFSGTDGERR